MYFNFVKDGNRITILLLVKIKENVLSCKNLVPAVLLLNAMLHGNRLKTSWEANDKHETARGQGSAPNNGSLNCPPLPSSCAAGSCSGLIWRNSTNLLLKMISAVDGCLHHRVVSFLVLFSKNWGLLYMLYKWNFILVALHAQIRILLIFFKVNYIPCTFSVMFVPTF